MREHQASSWRAATSNWISPRLGWLGLPCVVAAPISWLGLMFTLMSYEDSYTGSSGFPSYSFADMGPVLYLVHLLWPWSPYALALAGLFCIAAWLVRMALPRDAS